jgi:hypothetical protein
VIVYAFLLYKMFILGCAGFASNFFASKGREVKKDLFFMHFPCRSGRGEGGELFCTCLARDWDRIRITWGNPQSGCSDVCSYSKRATVGVRTPM